MPKHRYQIFLDDDVNAYLQALSVRYNWTVSTLVDRLARYHQNVQSSFEGEFRLEGDAAAAGQATCVLERGDGYKYRGLPLGLAIMALQIARDGLTPAGGFLSEYETVLMDTVPPVEVVDHE